MRTTNTNSFSYRLQSLVALALTALCLSAAPALAQPSITLDVTVRDFSNTHPDFDVPNSATNAHVADLVDLFLTPRGRPDGSAGGFKVNQEWSDRDGNDIAPHLFQYDTGGEVLLGSIPILDNIASLDTYDAAAGPASIGACGEPAIITDAILPLDPPLPDFGPSVGEGQPL